VGMRPSARGEQWAGRSRLWQWVNFGVGEGEGKFMKGEYSERDRVLALPEDEQGELVRWVVGNLEGAGEVGEASGEARY